MSARSSRSPGVRPVVLRSEPDHLRYGNGRDGRLARKGGRPGRRTLKDVEIDLLLEGVNPWKPARRIGNERRDPGPFKPGALVV